jgi:IS4 transposase
MDRGYVDFDRLHTLHQSHGFFVTRAKTNMAWRRVYSRPVDKSTGLRCDQSVRLTGYKSKKEYPELIRRVKFIDNETRITYVFLTNDFELDALLIAQLYKERWKVELFFKWIKQHLRIKSFFGTSRNAVYSQIWICICVYLLVAIIKKKLKVEHSLYTLLQIFSLTLFEKVPINELLANQQLQISNAGDDKQLKLFDL